MSTFTQIAAWFDTWGFDLFVKQLTRDLRVAVDGVGTAVLDTTHMSYHPAEPHCWIVFHMEDSNGDFIESYRIDGAFQSLTQTVDWDIESFRKVVELPAVEDSDYEEYTQEAKEFSEQVIRSAIDSYGLRKLMHELTEDEDKEVVIDIPVIGPLSRIFTEQWPFMTMVMFVVGSKAYRMWVGRNEQGELTSMKTGYEGQGVNGFHYLLEPEHSGLR
jgi:hypothetical protein